MTALGIPVPPGFTIDTSVCAEYTKSGSVDGLKEEVDSALQRLEKAAGRRLGDGGNPLLVSVRSGARSSMPGMMDTILNLGLNDKTTEGLSQISKNPRFAYDSYRRFIQMYSNVVMNMNGSILE